MYSFLIFFIVLYLLFEPLVCLSSFLCSFLSLSLSPIDILNLVPSEQVTVSLIPKSIPIIEFFLLHTGLSLSIKQVRQT